MPPKHIHTLVTIIGLAAISQPLSTARAQGSLTPPPGPPAPVMKTLDQIEPRLPIGPDTTPGNAHALYTISKPGSYFLTGNVTGVTGKHGIAIESGDVDLDLNGFTLKGIGTSIGVACSFPNVNVRRGIVQNWGTGVLLTGGSGQLEQVTSTQNSSHGFYLGPYMVMRDCVASDNANYGFITGDNCIAHSLVAKANFLGISLNAGGHLTDSLTVDNESHGITAGHDSQLTRVTSRRNGASGIMTGRAMIVSCQAIFNSGDGIHTSDTATLTDNLIVGNKGHGLRAEGPGPIVRGNTCRGNGTAAEPKAGIYLAGGGNSPGSFILADNTCHGNFGHGIHLASGYGQVVNNNSANNLADGIFVTSSHNRLDGNHLVNNGQTGLRVTGQYNFIIRNTARNTATNAVNWNIAQYNRAGAYVAPTNNAAIKNNTGGHGSGTTDPYANVSF